MAQSIVPLVVIDENETCFVIRMDDHPSPGYGSVVARVMKYDVGREHAKKLAYKMAAASDMLDVIETLIHLWETPGDFTDAELRAAWAEACDVVKKAHGEQP